MTLPGSIPGLLRRGSPCLLADGRPITIHGVRPHGAWGATGGQMFSGGELDGAKFEGLSLDLTDATGRAHAAWWLAGALRADIAEPMSVAVTYGHPDLGAPGFGLAILCRYDGALWRREDVPALANLDPNDERELPDGSRWVDAEALRLVCLHVAGLNQ